MTSIAISTQRLTHSYGPKLALHPLNFEVAAGEIFGLLGHNGAGKTTTVALLTTLLRPSGGTAKVAGHDIVVRQTRLAPGASSGWHYHDGTLFVLVTRGTLDHPYLRRGPRSYPRWRVFREPSGPDNVHVARNPGTAEVRIAVVYVNPAGSPLSHAVPTPPTD